MILLYPQYRVVDGLHTSSLMSLVLVRISGRLQLAADSECSTALRTP